MIMRLLIMQGLTRAPSRTRIDVFAVRQWPGNGADLDFRGVIAGCTAAIVAAAPIQGTLTSSKDEDSMADPHTKEAFLSSDEYAAVSKVLAFCRLWYVQITAKRGDLEPGTPVYQLRASVTHIPSGAWWRWLPY